MKYKKGDVVYFGNTKIEISSKRGADAMNKHKPKTMKDFKKFSRPMKNYSPVDRSERFLENNLIGTGFRRNRKGLTNLSSLDDLARM